MIKSGIYAILNLLNGKRYVGSAVNLEGRWRKHFCALRKGTHHNIHLQRAFQKYGESAFGWIILEYIEDLETLELRENLYLKIFPPELKYNMCPAAGSMLGFKFTEESKQRVREASSKRWADPEWCRMVLKIHRSAESKRRRSEAHKEKHPSAETKQKMRAAQLRRFADPEQRRMLGVIMSKCWEDPVYRQTVLEAINNPEIKQKQSETMLAWWADPEHHQNMLDISPVLGKSGEQNPFYGKHHTAETKHKISVALKKSWARRKRARGL